MLFLIPFETTTNRLSTVLRLKDLSSQFQCPKTNICFHWHNKQLKLFRFIHSLQWHLLFVIDSIQLLLLLNNKTFHQCEMIPCINWIHELMSIITTLTHGHWNVNQQAKMTWHFKALTVIDMWIGPTHFIRSFHCIHSVQFNDNNIVNFVLCTFASVGFIQKHIDKRNSLLSKEIIIIIYKKYSKCEMQMQKNFLNFSNKELAIQLIIQLVIELVIELIKNFLRIFYKKKIYYASANYYYFNRNIIKSNWFISLTILFGVFQMYLNVIESIL